MSYPIKIGSVYEFHHGGIGNKHRIDVISWPNTSIVNGDLGGELDAYSLQNMAGEQFLVLNIASLNRIISTTTGSYVQILTSTGTWWIDNYYFGNLVTIKIC